MSNANASPNVISADQLKSAALDAVVNRPVLGLLIMAGQAGIRVQSDVGTWPLPDGDYVVTMLQERLDVEPGARWLRVDPTTLAEPSAAVFDAAQIAAQELLVEALKDPLDSSGLSGVLRAAIPVLGAVIDRIRKGQAPTMPAPVAVADGDPGESKRN